MKNKPIVSDNLMLVADQPACIKAIFHLPTENQFFPIRATDDRGRFYGLEYDSIRPQLVEIIHSKAQVIRGNHVHQRCTEVFTALSGTLQIYLLCTCPEKHLLIKNIKAGTTVEIPPGVAHAIYTITENESTAVFGDGDPRSDRETVTLLRW